MYAFGVEDVDLLAAAKDGVSYPEWVIRWSVQDLLLRNHLPGRFAQLQGRADAPMLVAPAYFGRPGDRAALQEFSVTPATYDALPTPGDAVAEDIVIDRWTAEAVVGAGNAWGVPLRREDFMPVAVAWTDGRFEIEAELRGHDLGSAFTASVAALVDFYVLTSDDRAAIADAAGVLSGIDVIQPGAPSYWEACGAEYLGAFATRWSEWPPLRQPNERSEALIHDIVDLDPIPDPPANFITGV